MSTKLPPQPEAPDYAAANREGIQTDISTLPLRRQIEAASRLGQAVEYIDPVTGQKVTADFTGLGDATYAKQAAELAQATNAEVQRAQLALRKELGAANAAQTRDEIRAADPTGFATREDITNRVRAELNMGPAKVGPSVNIASAENRMWNLANSAPQDSGRLGALYDEANVAAPKANDMGALAKLGALESTAAQRLGTRADDMGTNATLQQLQQAARERLGTRAEDRVAQQRLGTIYDEATRLPGQVTDPTTEGLNAALFEAAKDYQRGGEMDPEIRRQMLNEIRAGQVARGNFLGDAAAVQEALELGQAAEARKAARLGTLLDVQGRAFGQNAQLRGESTANANNRLGQLANLQALSFGQNQSLRDEDRASASAQINSLSGLAQQLFGNNQALRQEDRDSALQQIGALSNLAQQQYGIGQSMRQEDQANRMQRLGMLQSLEGQQFGQRQNAYTTGLQAAQAAFQGTQAMANDQRAARQEGFNYDQQRLANANSVVLGAPLTNQFGSLGGAQQGTVAFTPINYQGGIAQNNNAGNQAAGFAQQSFGTNANMWQTAANIAQQDNASKMSAISGAAGMAMGMI